MIVDFSEFTAHKGEQLRIVVCPICQARRGEAYKDYACHLAGHSWSDLEGVMDRRRSKATADSGGVRA